MPLTSFMQGNYHSRTLLLFRYYLNETAAIPQRILVEAYGDHAFSKIQNFGWPDKVEKGHFKLENKKLGRPSRMFEEVEAASIFA